MNRRQTTAKLSSPSMTTSRQQHPRTHQKMTILGVSIFLATAAFAVLDGSRCCVEAFVPLNNHPRTFTTTAPIVSDVATHKTSLARRNPQHPTTGTASSTSTTSLHAFSGTPAAALGILASIILVHECGHYLAARGFGIDVEEFSIGIGPKIFGFKAFNNEFNLRALPLGGYVKFPENYNTTLVVEQEQIAIENAKEFRKSLPPKDLKDKLINAVTLGSIDEKLRNEEKQRRLQAAAAKSSNMPWWKKVTGASQGSGPTSSAAELLLDPDDVPIEYYDDPNLLQNRSWQQRAVVLSAGVIFNLLLSFFIYFGQINYGKGLPEPVFQSGALVNSIPSPDAAASGKLNKGDIVLSVNGRPITVSTSPSATEAQKGIANFIQTIRETPDGEALRLSVLHPGDTKPVDVSIQPKHGNAGPSTIGVLLSPNFVEAKVLKSNSVVEGARLAAKYAGEVTRDTAKGLIGVFGGLFQGKGLGSNVSGPIGLVKTGSQVVATQDWTTILLFAAAISINLGVVNALPLPALDGGQLVFVIAEALTGRKVDQRVQESINGAALFFLLLLSVSAAFSDIESFF